MKRSFLIAFVSIFLLYPFFGGISEGKELDGFDWAEMNMLQKGYFISGWLAGGFAFWKGITLDTLAIRLGITPWDRNPNLQKCAGITDEINKGVLEGKGFDLYNVATIQIVETVDAIYSDARVKLWEISKIMPIVRGRLKGGWTEKDVDEVIAYYIKLNELSNKFEGVLSKSKVEQDKLSKEKMLLDANEPKVLKALEAYRTAIQW